ncbi:MAG: DUF1611 domain-containing protein [Chloroflexota bacterium]|nr:DUF1611 domain-containing protein [Chloroflexota bacterium]
MGRRAEKRAGPRVAILAEGLFAPATAKTAIGAIRYASYPVVAVVDSSRSGRDAASCVGVGEGIPVVPNVAGALAAGAEVLLIGTASAGGRIPDGYRVPLAEALGAGLAVWSGLHDRILSDPQLALAARRGGARVRELREPPTNLEVGGRRHRRTASRVALTVGSDAAVGKMTASLELHAALERAGARSAFAATGQTGIAISGSGICVDAVVADFIAGAAERLVCDASETADWVVVEGQGSLTHPGFSGVTLGLLHGSAPDVLILCHDAARRVVKGHAAIPLRPLTDLIRIYEDAALWSRPAGSARVPVVAVALNTSALAAADARAAVAAAAEDTGLPAADPVRDDGGADRLAAAVLPA